MKDVTIGGTVRFTWVSSGTTPSSICAAVYNGSESLVHSESMVSSGSGHYYLDYTVPGSLGYYAVELSANINSNPYKRRLKVKVIAGDVD